MRHYNQEKPRFFSVFETERDAVRKGLGAQGRNRISLYPLELTSFFERRFSSGPVSVPGTFFVPGRLRLGAAIAGGRARRLRRLSWLGGRGPQAQLFSINFHFAYFGVDAPESSLT